MTRTLFTSTRKAAIIVAVALLAGIGLFFVISSGELPQKVAQEVNALPKVGLTKGIDYNMGLKPHKALYDIELVSTRSGSQIVNVSGKMLYEWQPTCDAWISNHRFDLLYEYADTAPMRITSDFSTYEPYDGNSLDYTSRRKRDGVLFEELRGHARIKETGVGEAVYTMPEGLIQELPMGTVFPMGHSRKMLEQIKKGRKFMAATIFDGSDEEGPVLVNSVLGKPANAVAQVNGSAALDMSLLNTPAWNMRLAFFPLNDDSTMSDYEMDIVFHENGVISDMLIQYDDFAITQKLVALEPLENNCKEEPASD